MISKHREAPNNHLLKPPPRIISNTKMSVSSDIQAPSIVKSNTGWGVSFDIQALRK